MNIIIVSYFSMWWLSRVYPECTCHQLYRWNEFFCWLWRNSE